MAKFYSYYVLCPLIDQNSFLGVSKDKEAETVIVTLGRNVVNKYRLSDQKQIGGWTSKDHITSTVIYDDEQESYVGVFNQNTIKAWKTENENLDKLKKYKFSEKILKIIPRQNQTSLIIFENGNCSSLPYGVDNRITSGHKPIIKQSEIITDVGAYKLENKDFICYVVKNTNNKKKEKYEILISPLREELGDLEIVELTREKVLRSDDVNVVGHLISTTNNNKVYFLWSDSKMSVFDLENKTWKNMVSVPWISTLSSVSLACMERNHLIMFGSNTEQDGAILVAYNVVLGIGSCRYPLKMYTQEAKLYCCNNKIILQGSNHIAMLPYMIESERNLSSLLGSHDIVSDDMEIVCWDSRKNEDLIVGSEMKDLWLKGLAERNICSQIMSALIEKKDLHSVYKTLFQFTDLPESLVVSLIATTVNSNNIDACNDEEVRKLCLCNDYEDIKNKRDLLKYLLQIPFSDALIIPQLRKLLSLDNALFLMSFIAHLIIDTELDMDCERKIYDWCILLMDTFYQQLLMTNDAKVTYVLEKVQTTVENLIYNMQLINNVMPLLNKVLHGTPIPEHKLTSSYAIDLLKI